MAIEPGSKSPERVSEEAEGKPTGGTPPAKKRPSAEEVASQSGDYREFLRKQAEESRARLGNALADKLKKK